MLDLESDEDFKEKNAATDFCYFSENNFFKKNFSKAVNTSNKTFSNNDNKEKLIIAGNKSK